MKTLIFPTIAALVLAVPSAALAGFRPVAVRALTMTAGFPVAGVYAHSPGSKDPGVKLKVKNFLNHEFDAIEVAGNNLVLTSKAEPSSIADKAAVIGEITVPAGLKSAILLFLPGKTMGTGTVRMVADGKSDFPPGAILFVNATRSDLRMEIEGKPFEAKAGENLVIRDQPIADNQSSNVKAFIMVGGKWVQFSSAIWPHPGKKRVLKVAAESSQAGKIELRDIKDISMPR